MSPQAEVEAKLWDAVKSDRTVMLGLETDRAPHPVPMTAQIEGDAGGPVWFFTARDTDLAESVKGERRAFFTLAGKGHDLFATVHGRLVLDNDPEMIDRLWNPFVAAWHEKGKDDPKLALLRFDPDDAEIWLNGSSLVAGVKALFGVDPKRDYRDKVAEVPLGTRDDGGRRTSH